MHISNLLVFNKLIEPVLELLVKIFINSSFITLLLLGTLVLGCRRSTNTAHSSSVELHILLICFLKL